MAAKAKSAAAKPADYRLLTLRTYPNGHGRCGIARCRLPCAIRFDLVGLGMIGCIGACRKHLFQYEGRPDALIRAVAEGELDRPPLRKKGR